MPIPSEDNALFTYWFDLGKEISIEGRTVVSFPQLFGDLSGIKDFFNFFILFIISSPQAKMYDFNRLKTFFRFNDLGTAT